MSIKFACQIKVLITHVYSYPFFNFLLQAFTSLRALTTTTQTSVQRVDFQQKRRMTCLSKHFKLHVHMLWFNLILSSKFILLFLGIVIYHMITSLKHRKIKFEHRIKLYHNNIHFRTHVNNILCFSLPFRAKILQVSKKLTKTMGYWKGAYNIIYLLSTCISDQEISGGN